ncbi:hypothetical protein CKAH01_08033 [Colletotrichum kahawae]|uniref:Uncharacterized protein n=1 Tax=Colletotrichum kahawae TaxID=34407 RepID=A0AAE0CZZ8_COLKA|nr:hypothetical protein CKAH01_08033 [Colletotrichum kahawae]
MSAVKTRASDHYLKMYGDGEPGVQFDNTCNGPLNVPGFPLAVSIERCHDERFAHGFNDWAQDRLTAREIAMISLINDITDKPGWSKDVFNDVKVASWRAEALARTLVSPLAWDWCLLELQHMAKDADERGHICVLNTASRVCKSDGLVSLSLLEELRLRTDSVWRDYPFGVDPNMFPLVYGETKVFSQGSEVDLEHVIDSVGKGETASRQLLEPLTTAKRRENMRNHRRQWLNSWETHTERFSNRFQWLPCEVDFSEANPNSDRCPDVKITSYINSLHPRVHKSLYSTIEQFISLSIQPWNDVLAYRNQGLCPSRIKTFGVVWWPPSPDWAAGLDKIEKDRTTEEYRETKHERLKHWLHPEPGISFTYDDWRQGKTAKALVRGRIPRQPLTKFVSELSPLEPGPDHQFYTLSLKDRFLKQGLQVIVQLSTVDLIPENPIQPPTEWRLNGMGNEHIVATSLVYFDSINITKTSGAISFRVEADLDADAHVYNRGDLAPLAGIYGLADPRQLSADSEEPNALQELGTILAPDGRLVAYPNTLQHRIEAYEVLDRSRPGRRRCLTVHLVDPHYRICSTRNVPPQQHDWWVEEGPAKIDWAGRRVPQEMITRIMTEVREWPMGMQEATRVRDEVISEHLAGMEAVQDRVMRYQFD